MALQTLDERIVPDATIVTPPGATPPVQVAPQQAAVTAVAVFPLVTETGVFNNTYLILEQAGSEYVVTEYDATTNTLFTGTDLTNTALYLSATAELNAMMQQFGTPGSLVNIAFLDANQNYQAPNVIAGSLPPAAGSVGNPGLFPIAPSTIYPPGGLFPYPPSTGSFPYIPFNPLFPSTLPPSQWPINPPQPPVLAPFNSGNPIPSPLDWGPILRPPGVDPFDRGPKPWDPIIRPGQLPPRLPPLPGQGIPPGTMP